MDCRRYSSPYARSNAWQALMCIGGACNSGGFQVHCAANFLVNGTYFG